MTSGARPGCRDRARFDRPPASPGGRARCLRSMARGNGRRRSRPRLRTFHDASLRGRPRTSPRARLLMRERGGAADSGTATPFRAPRGGRRKRRRLLRARDRPQRLPGCGRTRRRGQRHRRRRKRGCLPRPARRLHCGPPPGRRAVASRRRSLGRADLRRCGSRQVNESVSPVRPSPGRSRSEFHARPSEYDDAVEHASQRRSSCVVSLRRGRRPAGRAPIIRAWPRVPAPP